MAREKERLSAFERIVQAAMGDNRTLGLDTDPTKEECPELWRFLTTIYVGRDKLMTPGKITLQLGPEGCLVQLVVRDIAHSIGVGCPHIDGWARALESALAGPNPPWQPWGRKEPNLRKRKSGN